MRLLDSETEAQQKILHYHMITFKKLDQNRMTGTFNLDSCEKIFASLKSIGVLSH